MKAEELRVGNYIQAGGTIVRVDAIEYNEQGCYVIKMWPAFPEKRIDVTVQLDDRFPNYAQPIPLTEELLSKLGYIVCEDVGSYDCYFKGAVNLSLQFYPTTGNREYDAATIDGAKRVEYLHQLQNLCFALTGKELKVTL